jgi:hypothetical protein
VLNKAKMTSIHFPFSLAANIKNSPKYFTCGGKGRHFVIAVAILKMGEIAMANDDFRNSII